MNDTACTWPEQNAVDKWWKSHSMELKQAVSAYRIAVQRAAKQAEAQPAQATNSASLSCVGCQFEDTAKPGRPGWRSRSPCEDCIRSGGTDYYHPARQA